MTKRSHQIRILCSLLALGACAKTSEPDSAGGNPVAETRWLKDTTGVRGIFEDRSGNLWFTSPQWICRFDPSARDSASGGFTYFEDNRKGVLNGGIQQAPDGRILMQDANGIHVYEDGKFEPIPARRYGPKQPWAKADGDLWFGVDGSVALGGKEKQWGVYRYRDGACTFLALPAPSAGERHGFYALTSGAMHAKDGTVWFGTFNAAFGFDGESFDFVGRERMGRADDSRDIGIRGYYLDSRDYLWMADNGAGVYVYDGEKVVHFTALHKLRDEDTEGSSLHRAFTIAEDDDGNMWIGTAYSGIWRYQPSAADPIGAGTLTNFGAAEGWPCKSIWTIYKTRSGELLFAGHEPAGVFRFANGSFERAF